MIGRRLLGRCALLLCALVLTGCATPSRQAQPGEAFWSGRMGLNIQSQPPQSLSAAFELQGSAERGELLLLSPIGSTLAQLRWSPQNAELSQGDRLWRSASLDDLTRQLTGTALPIAALFDWLGGQATSPAGWRVDLSQLPQGRIEAQRQSPEPAVLLKLLLER
jgi:outer membrane lipoprotein LolB